MGLAFRFLFIAGLLYVAFLAIRALWRWFPRERRPRDSDPPPGTRPDAMAIDPVCGMPLLARQQTRRTDHAGRTYYFCSDHCAELFERTPERYCGREPGAGAQGRPVTE